MPRSGGCFVLRARVDGGRLAEPLLAPSNGFEAKVDIQTPGVDAPEVIEPVKRTAIRSRL